MSGRYSYHFDWSDDAIAMLRRLHADSCTAIEIAEKIGREFEMRVSRSSVLGKLHRLGLTRRAERKTAAKRAQENSNSNKGATFLARLEAAPDDRFACTEVVDLELESSPHAVSLLDAREGQCRWPLNDPESEFAFCGAPAHSGSSYCPHHHLRSIGRVRILSAGEHARRSVAARRRFRREHGEAA